MTRRRNDRRVPHDDAQDIDEFMGELRVALPGAQVVFGFLLTVPFSSTFAELSAFVRSVYFAALCLAATASVLLIAPSIIRQLMRNADRDDLLAPATGITFAGLGTLAGSLVCALYVVGAVVFSGAVAAVVAGGAVIACACAWVAAPLSISRRRSR